MEKKLGKIQKVHFGLSDGTIGLQFTLGDGSWGVCSRFRGAWLKRPESAKWSEGDRMQTLSDMVLYLGGLLVDAKKNDIAELVGMPIEATFDGMVLQDFRILTEVL